MMNLLNENQSSIEISKLKNNFEQSFSNIKMIVLLDLLIKIHYLLVDMFKKSRELKLKSTENFNQVKQRT
jgi:hypothetical protein